MGTGFPWTVLMAKVTSRKCPRPLDCTLEGGWNDKCQVMHLAEGWIWPSCCRPGLCGLLQPQRLPRGLGRGSTEKRRPRSRGRGGPGVLIWTQALDLGSAAC